MLNLIKYFVPFRQIFSLLKFHLRINSSQAVCRGRHTLQARIISSVFILTFTFLFSACNQNDGGPEYFKDVKVISAGYDIGSEISYTAVIKTDDTLWAWGANRDGQLGDGTKIDRSVPVQIGTDANWKIVSAGGIFTVAIKTDGTLWAWGGGTVYPARVGADANWSTVSAGDIFTVVINENGELYVWDFYDIGQDLVQVGADKNWRTVSAGVAGGYHAAAITKDGRLYEWNDIVNTLTPTRVGAATNWLKVSAGGSYTVAINEKGELYVWGDNKFGQLGNGSTGGTIATPLKIKEPGPWMAAYAGYDHTIAIKKDGTLWAWGDSNYGQMGVNTIMFSLSPIRVGKEKWIAACTGSYHTVAIKDNGILYAWGWNFYGQLGDGTTIDRSTPTKVTAPD